MDFADKWRFSDEQRDQHAAQGERGGGKHNGPDTRDLDRVELRDGIKFAFQEELFRSILALSGVSGTDTLFEMQIKLNTGASFRVETPSIIPGFSRQEESGKNRSVGVKLGTPKIFDGGRILSLPVFLSFQGQKGVIYFDGEKENFNKFAAINLQHISNHEIHEDHEPS